MRKKQKTPPLSTAGVIFTSLFYMALLPFFLKTVLTSTAFSLSFFFFLLMTLLTIGFQFNHIDAYTKQRSDEYNIAGCIVFFIVTMFLINGVVEG